VQTDRITNKKYHLSADYLMKFLVDRVLGGGRERGKKGIEGRMMGIKNMRAGEGCGVRIRSK
jgi:hypothetical protein